VRTLVIEHISSTYFVSFEAHGATQKVKILFQIASELNAAILRSEHSENTQPKVATALKLLMWAQSELDKKRIRYPKIGDLAAGKVDDLKWNKFQF